MIVVAELFTCSRMIAKIPTDAKTQNDVKAGKVEEDPIAKAIKLVTEVTVMADPAWPKAALILSGTFLLFSLSEIIEYHKLQN